MSDEEAICRLLLGLVGGVITGAVVLYLIFA